MRKFFPYTFLLLACFFTSTIVFSQNVKDTIEDDGDEVVDPDFQPMTKAGNTVRGKWYGIGNAITKNNTNSYLCELLIKEDKKGKVTGYFNYFFRDGYFSNKLYGTYDKSTQVFKFKPVIILFHQTIKANIGVDVPMFGDFNLNLNSKDTTLTGFLTPVSNYKYLAPAINVKMSIIGKNEPTLKERVRKRKLELEEDEDVASILKEHEKDSIAKLKNNPKIAEKQKTSLTQGYQRDHDKGSLTNNNKGKSVLTNLDNNKYNQKSRDSLHFNDVQKNYQNDTLKFNDKPKIVVENKLDVGSVNSIQKEIEEAFHRRTTNIANNSLIVKDDSVTIVLYDNGEFDHDSVSVFFNGKLIASNVELKTKVPSKFVIHLDPSPGAKNELTLFAENLGTLPPNSALMIITDDHDTRHEVNLKSDLSHNVSVMLVPKLN